MGREAPETPPWFRGLLRSRRAESELDAAALRELAESFKSFFDFPTEPRPQLTEAIRAVFDSWMGERAVQYWRTNRLPDDLGTPANVKDGVREQGRIVVLRGGLD